MPTTPETAPPFVVGVTGVMAIDPNPDVRKDVEDAVRAYLSGLFRPDPKHKDRPVLTWTPVLVLTSLAPGADVLVARVVEKLEDDYQEQRTKDGDKHRGPPTRFRLAAPVPFPPDLYPRASTFADKRGTEADRTYGKKLLAELAADGRAFFVPLAEDTGRTKDELKQVLEADLQDSYRRHLRYRAAGEYVAAHSNTLLVLNDQTGLAAEKCDDAIRVPLADEFARSRNLRPGSTDVLGVKRVGVTRGLLADDGGFSWADSGPVVHVYTPRAVPAASPPTGPPPAAPPRPGAVTVLYPVDTRPTEGAVANGDGDWQERAGHLFGTIRSQLEAFNARRADFERDTNRKPDPKDIPDPEKELARMVALPAAVTADHHDGLDRLARARFWVARLVRKRHAPRWHRLHVALFVLAFLSAFSLHLAVHWHPAVEADPDHHALAVFRLRYAAGAGVFALLAGVLFFLHWRTGREPHRYDDRALTEALRVQFYWAAAGLDQSAAANYMQRQRTEMVWVRWAIDTLAAPYARWRDGFDALGLADRVALLKSIAARWVRWDDRLDPGTGQSLKNLRKNAQAAYTERLGRDWHGWESFWRRLGGELAVAGIAQVATWMVWTYNPGPFAHTLPVWTYGVMIGAGLGGVAALLVGRWWTNRAHLQLPNADPAPVPWRKKIPAFVLMVGLICLTTAGAATLLGEPALRDHETGRSWPGPMQWWVIGFGSLFLGGALAIAWVERNLMSEQSRQYLALSTMYQAAGRRLLGHLLDADEALKKGDEARAKDRVAAARELIYQVGLQALDENAAWLILHRARPTEPVLAG